jgi:hypothetical protein
VDGALCEVCEEEPAIARCRICGRLVCAKDFEASLGICRVCLSTLCQICHERLAVGHCARCGRLVCRRDSVRVGLSRYCIDCARALGILPATRQEEVGDPDYPD